MGSCLQHKDESDWPVLDEKWRDKPSKPTATDYEEQISTLAASHARQAEVIRVLLEALEIQLKHYSGCEGLRDELRCKSCRHARATIEAVKELLNADMESVGRTDHAAADRPSPDMDVER